MIIDNNLDNTKDLTTPKDIPTNSSLEQKVDAINENKVSEKEQAQSGESEIKTAKRITAFEQQFYF